MFFVGNKYVNNKVNKYLKGKNELERIYRRNLYSAIFRGVVTKLLTYFTVYMNKTFLENKLKLALYAYNFLICFYIIDNKIENNF